LKAGIGSAVAIITAEMLGLSYSPSAGIITLLTIQNTKKETLNIAAKRVLSFLLAVIVSYILFNSLGYNPLVFGSFILLFCGLSYLFDLKEGISMNAVLTTHFLIEKRMDIPLFANEILLLVIGMGIGIAVNMFMPNYRKEIFIKQHMLEEEFKKVLAAMALALKGKKACLIQERLEPEPVEKKQKEYSDHFALNLGQGKSAYKIKNRDLGSQVSDKENIEYKNDNLGSGISDKSMSDNGTPNSGSDVKTRPLSEAQIIDFRNLETLLGELMQKAYEDAGNRLLSDTRYMITYLEMRKHQAEVLKEISRNISDIPVMLKQSIPLADFLEKIAATFHEMNNAKGLLEDLSSLYDHYKQDKLPVTREEFEYRAVLFQILKQLEYFLLIKRNFAVEIENRNMKTYWNNK